MHRSNLLHVAARLCWDLLDTTQLKVYSLFETSIAHSKLVEAKVVLVAIVAC